MSMDPVCEGARALGHSLPSWHWWLSLNSTDQGTWFSGMGAFAAAVVALGIALSDGWRRRYERRARARLTMASFYSPMVGIYAMVLGFKKDGAIVAGAAAGTAVRQVAGHVESLKHGADIAREQMGQCSFADAVHLPGDFGPQLAVVLRNVELMVYMVTSCTEVYLPRMQSTDPKDLAKMHGAAGNLKDIPGMAATALKQIKPFLDACEKDLGLLIPLNAAGVPSP